MNLIEKVKNNKRLNFDEAVALYDLDLFTLGELADERRRALHGKQTYFNINRHINPTNICKDVCKFCAYSASRKNPNPYTMKNWCQKIGVKKLVSKNWCQKIGVKKLVSGIYF